MLTPRLELTACHHRQGQHRMAWWSWGDVNADHVIVCVHGLTRQGRDFDWLAHALVERAQGRLHVVCPDVAGRGRSDWLPEPALYQLGQYVADMQVLLAQLQQSANLQTLDWVGTSMGGLMGMVWAGGPTRSWPVPIRRLVLNDVGPAMTWASIEHMQQYVGRFEPMADLPQAAALLRRLLPGFGPVPQDVWLALSEHCVRQLADGRLTFHYDPAIGEPIRALTPQLAQAAQTATWALYEQIQAQVLLIRGMDSQLLTEETAVAMAERGPRAQLLQWPGVGHAPTLTDPHHIAAVVDFLLDAQP